MSSLPLDHLNSIREVHIDTADQRELALSLSLSLQAMSTSNTMATSNSLTDSHFPFMKLPAELRNRIYLFLLANGVMKIRSPYQEDDPLHYDHRLSTYFRGHKLPPLSLLRVCKSIYGETHLLLYRSNTFEMYSSEVAQFLQPRTPTQLCSMRSLTIIVPII